MQEEERRLAFKTIGIDYRWKNCPFSLQFVDIARRFITLSVLLVFSILTRESCLMPYIARAHIQSMLLLFWCMQSVVCESRLFVLAQVQLMRWHQAQFKGSEPLNQPEERRRKKETTVLEKDKRNEMCKIKPSPEESTNHRSAIVTLALSFSASDYTYTLDYNTPIFEFDFSWYYFWNRLVRVSYSPRIYYRALLFKYVSCAVHSSHTTYI